MDKCQWYTKPRSNTGHNQIDTLDFPADILYHRLQDVLRSTALFLPEVLLSALFIVLVLVGLIFKSKNNLSTYITLAGLAATIPFLVEQWKYGLETETFLFNGMLRFSAMAVYFKFLFLGAAFIIVLFTSLSSFYKKASEVRYEYFLVLIASVIGLNLVVMSSNLLMLYLSLELVSIASYILVAIIADRKGAESGIKYFIYGIVSSALMLYGISFLYGMTGTLNLYHENFIERLILVDGWLLLLATMLFLSGLLFKVAAFPFHIWVPDVYEGAPIPVIAWLSSAPKAAGFAVLFILIPLLNAVFGASEVVVQNWNYYVAILAIFTIAIGNFAALKQTDVKRLLAYSSIAHAGFLLAGLSVGSELAFNSIVFYLSVYVFMNSAAFFMVEFLSGITGSTDVRNYRGLGYKIPFAGVIFVIVLIALTGLPPTAGFTAKLLLFSSVWEGVGTDTSGIMLFLLIFGLLNTVISLYYYLKIPYLMYFRKGDNNNNETIPGVGNYAFLVIVALPVLILFFKPDWLMNFIELLNFHL
ncbi:NADH-quinone oxidoreductase subunit N [Cytophagaceae bacterium ABcell3]|nr:NADH-quinone oxidoreductase subunit N [Cytophagaceae bacterium ABcell3]